MREEVRYINGNDKSDEFIINFDYDDQVKEVTLCVPVERDPVLFMISQEFSLQLLVLLILCKCRNNL